MDIRSIGIEADVVAVGTNRRNSGTSRSHERIEHYIALVRVELNQALRECDWKGRGMAYTSCAFGRDLPQVGSSLQELIARDRRRRREIGLVPLFRLQCPVKTALTGNHDPLSDVP